MPYILARQTGRNKKQLHKDFSLYYKYMGDYVSENKMRFITTCIDMQCIFVLAYPIEYRAFVMFFFQFIIYYSNSHGLKWSQKTLNYWLQPQNHLMLKSAFSAKSLHCK